MKGKRIVSIILGAVAVFVAVAGITFAISPATWQQVSGQVSLSKPEADGLVASGFIEAEEVTIAPELGGRVVELLVAEGDDVEAGQVLVRLDGTLLEAQIEVAQAALDVAQAGLAQARAGVRPEKIRQAEAALAQATVPTRPGRMPSPSATTPRSWMPRLPRRGHRWPLPRLG